jgi:hypothetical protein
MNKVNFNITNDTITVIWKGKPVIVKKGQSNFAMLRNVLLNENGDAVERNLTAMKSLEDWAQGNFTVNGDTVFYNGEALPEKLNKRIVEMATKGESPLPFFKFWENLKLNPSKRSVDQLWDFLNHAGIPLTEDGHFLAYKSVKENFLDHHSGTISNHPGTVVKMERNQISDDPQHPCHEGLHVGALGYVGSQYGSDSNIVIVRVNPRDVVCVPYDHSFMKMRVCEYLVQGLYVAPLSSTTQKDEDDGEEEFDTDEKTVVEGVGRKDKFDDMKSSELLAHTIAELRQYAKRLKIVGASKIPGGKVKLIAEILKVRKRLSK